MTRSHTRSTKTPRTKRTVCKRCVSRRPKAYETVSSGAAVSAKAGAIAGVINDRFMRRLSGVRVVATSVEGRTEAESDERGCYRLFGLAPGHYVVTVAYEGTAGHAVADVVVGHVTHASLRIRTHGDPRPLPRCKNPEGDPYPDVPPRGMEPRRSPWK